jgi:hypothetical protein
MALTPESRRQRALEEVRAHRPAGLQEVTTLEFGHPAFDAPARVVADNADLLARLETGEVVTFLAVAFTHAGPSLGDGRWPQIELGIDNAASILEPHLEAALATAAPVTLTVRVYVRQFALEGPGRIIRGLELDRTRASDLRISAVAGFFGLDRKFGTTYDPSRYPGLS